MEDFLAELFSIADLYYAPRIVFTIVLSRSEVIATTEDLYKN